MSLRTEKQRVEAWLSPEQAKEFAAAVFAARFGLPKLEVIAPRQKRRTPVYIVFQSEPAVLGSRPWDFSQAALDTLASDEERDRAIAGRKKEQERWDRAWVRSKEGKAAKERASLLPPAIPGQRAFLIEPE